MKRLVFLLFMVLAQGFSSGVATAAPAEPTVSIAHFSREFPQHAVTSIAQDRQGFIWFGTWNGLCRYDGYSFRYFKTNADSGIILSTHRIRALHIGSGNKIWGITNDYQCFLLDTATETFSDPLAGIPTDDGQPLHTYGIFMSQEGVVWIACQGGYAIRVDENALDDNPDGTDAVTVHRIGPDERIENICNDSEGNVWLMLDGAVRVPGGRKRTEHVGASYICPTERAVWLAERNGTLWRYPHGSEQPEQVMLPAEYGRVCNIGRIGSDTLGICTENGLAVYYAAQRRSHFVPLQGGETKSFRKDSHGRLWIFAENDGVGLYDPVRDKLTHLQNNPDDIPAWGQQNTHFWYENAEGLIFMVPHNGSLCFFNEETGELQPLRTFDGQRYMSGTRSLFIDRQGNIWCSEIDGVSRISIQTQYIRNHVMPDRRETRAMLSDRYGRLWACLRDHTVLIFDAQNRMTGYLHPDGHIRPEPARLESPVYGILEEPNGGIWIGLRFNGLMHLEPVDANHYRVERFCHNPDDIYSLNDDDIFDICLDSRGRLWAATWGGGINIAEKPAGGGVLRFRHSANGLQYPQNTFGRVRVLKEADRCLFAGTASGLLVCSTDSDCIDSMRFHEYTIYGKCESRLPANEVRAIHQDSRGRLWILTFPGGLSRLKHEPGRADDITFEHYTHENGLCSELVCSMIEDPAGNQWIISETEAFRFDPETGSFESFGEYYAVQDSYFCEAKPILHQGQILAGTTTGYATIPALDRQTSDYIPPIVLTGVRINGRTAYRGVSALDRLTLMSDERDLQISFAALDYKSPASLRYAWRFDGDEREWNQLGEAHSINLVDMDAGKYDLLIRATNSDGVWVDNVRRLHIEVQPAFWETKWAYLLYALAVAVAIIVPVYLIQLRSRIRLEQALSEIILLPSKASVDERISELKTEVDEYLPIPFHAGYLMTRIRTLLERRRELQQQTLIQSSEQERQVESVELQFAKRALDIVTEHLDDPEWSVARFAEQMHLSPRVFYQKIKSATGLSPVEYIREVRMTHAERLIREGHYDVATVSYMVGFSDPKYFSRMFKARFGTTPHQYARAEELPIQAN